MADDQPKSSQEQLDELTQQMGQEALEYAEQHDKQFKSGSSRLPYEEDDEPGRPAPQRAETDDQTEAQQAETDGRPDDLSAFWQDFLGGKYAKAQDPKGEAERSIHEAYQALSSERKRNDELQQQLLASLGAARQTPSERQQKRDALKQLEEQYGVSSELLEEAVTSRTRPLEEQLGQITEWLRSAATEAVAHQEMKKRYGDEYETLAPKVREFVETDPTLKPQWDAARASGQHLLANEWAVAKYRERYGAEVEKAQKANDEVRKQIVSEQKKDAAITGAKRSDARQPKSADDDKYIEADEWQGLLAAYKAGYPQKLIRRAFAGQIPDEI